MKKGKGETEEARKRAEEQIETMRKEHEEKVIFFFIVWFVKRSFYVCKGNLASPQEYVNKCSCEVAALKLGRNGRPSY